MKLLIALLILAFFWVTFDDLTQRKSLSETRQERDQLQMQLAQASERVANVAVKPNWFQQRMRERPPLEANRSYQPLPVKY